MADAHVEHDTDDRPGILSNVIAVIAFILVIAIVLWGLLHLAGISTSWFSSFFPRSAPTIQVTAPANVDSGSSFTLSWKYSPSTTGSYALLYQCRDGVSMKTPGANGTLASIPCGAAYTIPGNSNAVFLTPTLTGIASSSIPLSVIFMPSLPAQAGATGTAQAQGTTAITIHAAAITTPPPASGNAGSSGSPSTPKLTTYKGPADLSVRIISATGGSMATVTFDIANVGGSSSGTYHFSAYLPTSSGYTYYSLAQASLNPGDHVVNTLTFTQAQGGTVSVTVQPGSSDATTANNSVSQIITGGNTVQYMDQPPYQYGNTYYGYQPPQYTYPTRYQYPYQYGTQYNGGVQYLY